MKNGLKGTSGLTRLINATGYSLSGLKAAFRDEAAFRQEVVLAALLIPVALFSRHTGSEKALLAGSVLLVLITELLNSAVESLTDRISTEIHPLSKKAKDVGSAAVLVSLVNLALFWWFIFLEPLLAG